MIFLTFAVDILFLVINLVWNKNLAELIDLVTAGSTAGVVTTGNSAASVVSEAAIQITGNSAGNTVFPKMLVQLLIILAAFIFWSGANAFVSGVTSARMNYELRTNYLLQQKANELKL